MSCIYSILRQRLYSSHVVCRYNYHKAGVIKSCVFWQKPCERTYTTRSRSNIVRDKSRAIRNNVLEVIYGGRENVPEDATWKDLVIPEDGSSDEEMIASNEPKGLEIKQRAFLKESTEYERSSLDHLYLLYRESVSRENIDAQGLLMSLKERVFQNDMANNILSLCKLSPDQRSVIMKSAGQENLGEYLCRAMPDMKTDTFVQSLLIFYWWGLNLSPVQNTLIKNECLQRMSSWEVDTLLIVTDWWICMSGASSWRFHKEMLSILRTFWTTLSAQQMVQAFYLCGQFKQPAQSLMKKLTILAERYVDELSLSEIAAICNGMIKGSGRLPSNSILPSVISTALSKDIPLQTDLDKYNVITIMRFLGRSYHYDQDLYSKLAKQLVPHIPDMNQLALPHIAAVYARAAVLDEALFNQILQCFDHSKANLKDYFLTLWSFCRLNYTSDDFGTFVEKAISRIEGNEEWTSESTFVFVKTLVPLSFVGIYPERLLHRAFSSAYLNKYTGLCPPDVYKHLYCLGCSVAIECPHYSLPKDISSRSILTPHGSTKVVGDERKAYAGIINILSRVLGSKDAFLVHPILDHIRTPVDIELHLDGHNRPINLKASKGKPTDPSTTKLAVLVAPETHYRRNSKELLGVHVMKKRQLKIAGYHIVEIPYYEWNDVREQSTEKQNLYFTHKIFNR